MTGDRDSAEQTPRAGRARAVIFDLDGTLVDSSGGIARSMNQVLAREGLPQHSVERVKTFIGWGLAGLVQRATPPERQAADEQARLVAAHLEIYAETWHIDVAIYEGIEALLERLVAAGAPIAVLSNKGHPFTVRMVERFLGRFPWVAVEGAKPEVPKKPDPAAALAIAARLGVPPAETVFVGDTPTDVHTARNAGMVGCAVGWGFRSRAELEAAGCEHYVEAPAEIEALLAPELLATVPAS